MGRKKIELTEAQRNELEVLWRYGNTYEEIGKKMGLSKSVINRDMLRHGKRIRSVGKTLSRHEPIEVKQDIKGEPKEQVQQLKIEQLSPPIKTEKKEIKQHIRMSLIVPKDALQDVLQDLKNNPLAVDMAIQIKVEV